MASTTKSKCLFCRIANNEDNNTRILFDQDDIVIFQDIHPAASHHYLVVPKTHIIDAKHLQATDIPLVEKLSSFGLGFLETQGGSTGDVRMGFHWPPFHSVSHLHLHVISPHQEMGWLSKSIFKPGSLWFKTDQWVLQRLKEKGSSLV